MFSFRVFHISWSAPVKANTAINVEAVIMGRTILKVFMDVLLGRMDCMPNMLWLKKGDCLLELKRKCYGFEW